VPPILQSLYIKWSLFGKMTNFNDIWRSHNFTHVRSGPIFKGFKKKSSVKKSDKVVLWLILKYSVMYNYSVIYVNYLLRNHLI
jgi:hypothetical protein